MNIPAEAEFLLQSLEQKVRGIGLYVNSDKTEFMSFNQDDTVSTLNGKPLLLVDHFIYLDSNISSTESTIYIRMGSYWQANDQMEISFLL